MKRVYKAPVLEIEHYSLDMSIASNCRSVIDMGPEGPTPEYTVCKSYYDKTGEDYPKGIQMFSLPKNITFWTDATCDCYTTAGGEGYFTS